MRRRHFLATATWAASIGLAGCSAVVPPGSAYHPFANARVSVAVDNQSDTEHDVHELTKRALEYWEVESRRYAGFYVRFVLNSNENPDLIVRFMDTPEQCRAVENYSERVLGCAPIIRPGRTLTGPVRALVVAADRPPGKITITTKHEIGHILGLGHDDEPQEIMSHLPELRIPQFALRIEIWESVLDAHASSSRGTDQLGEGHDMWQLAAYDDASRAYDDASKSFGDASTFLRSARERIRAFSDDPQVETVDLPALESHLDHLINRKDLAERYARAMHTAANAADQDEFTATNAALDEAREHARRFNDIPIVELRDIAVSLGLVRGFDRDEPVSDPDVSEDPIDD